MAGTKQYAERVNKRIKVNGKWSFAPVVQRNGRIIRDHVLISGRDGHHPRLARASCTLGGTDR
jgi:hypothetical protein